MKFADQPNKTRECQGCKQRTNDDGQKPIPVLSLVRFYCGGFVRRSETSPKVQFHGRETSNIRVIMGQLRLRLIVSCSMADAKEAELASDL
jgi:hypothetical protein